MSAAKPRHWRTHTHGDRHSWSLQSSYIKGRNIQSNSSTSDVSKTSSVTSVTFATCAYNLKSGQNIEPKLSTISWRHSGLIKLVAVNTERQILTSIREYFILIYFLLYQLWIYRYSYLNGNIWNDLHFQYPYFSLRSFQINHKNTYIL